VSPDLALYLARQGLQQGPLPGSTTPHDVGYAYGSEPEPEEDPMPPHVPAVNGPRTCEEASRSTVDTVTLKLKGYPELRTGDAFDSRMFRPSRIRVVVGRSTGRGTTLISARVTGPFSARDAARQPGCTEATLQLPTTLGGAGWPDWIYEIVRRIMTEGETTMPRPKREDDDVRDAREELERLVEAEEEAQGNGDDDS